LTDELGNYLTDENGNFIVVEGANEFNYFDDLIFSVRAGGTMFTFVVWETSTAIYEIVRTKVKGHIARRII
jgi:hypothetical protein